MPAGLYTALIDFLKAEEAENDEGVLGGLSDMQQTMVREYAEAEHLSLKASREQLHL